MTSPSTFGVFLPNLAIFTKLRQLQSLKITGFKCFDICTHKDEELHSASRRELIYSVQNQYFRKEKNSEFHYAYNFQLWCKVILGNKLSLLFFLSQNSVIKIQFIKQF